MKSEKVLAPLDGLVKIVLWGFGGYVVGSTFVTLQRQARAQEGIERQLSQLNARQLSVSGWGTYR